MNNKILILLFMLIFIIPVSFANTNYNQSGGIDGKFQQGRGIFNENLDSFDTITVVLDNDKHNVPLVADLDGNGVNEIIIHDGSEIRIFDATDMSEYVGIDMEKDEPTSNMILFDIDDDNRTEIILALETSEDMRIIEFNGTHLINDSSFPIFPPSTPLPQYMIGCGTGTVIDRRCIIVAVGHVTTDANTNVRIGIFNKTNVSYNQKLDDSSGGGFKNCLPKIRNIVYADYDADGANEFIFTTMVMTKAGSEVLKIWYTAITSDKSFTFELNISTSSSGSDTLNPFVSGAGADCRQAGLFFTSPLVHDIRQSTSGLETVVGVSISDEEFKMTSYKKNGDELDDYPETLKADGKLISNVMLASVFPGSGNNDFCVMGYHDVNEELELLCAHETGITTVADREFKFSTAGIYNLTSTDYDDWSIITHSAQHSTEQTTVSGNSADLSEFVTSYGILRLDWNTDFSFQLPTSILTLERIFVNPNDAGSLISIDARQENVPTGSEDLIFLNDNNLFYYDDEFANTAGQISSYTVNPCIDSVWKINTTVEVVIAVTDFDNDDVSSRIIAYREDLTNEQDSNWTANVSSGTSVPFFFPANKTTTSGTLRLMGRDTENLNNPDIIDLSFSVGANGVEFGDCITEVEIDVFVDEDAEVTATLTVDATDNAIENALTTFSGFTGLGGTTLWLIIMMMGAYFIYSTMAERNLSGNSALGTIAIFELLAIIVGARLGIISTGLLVTIVVVAVVVFGVFLGKFLTGNQQPS